MQLHTKYNTFGDFNFELKMNTDTFTCTYFYEHACN